MHTYFLAAGVSCLCVLSSSTAWAATRVVRAGENLQTAINAARAGDELRLEAGATFTGNFTLPVVGGATSSITLRTDLPDTDLPGEMQRVTPSDASRFARIVSPNSAPALRTASGAHHWRILFIEFPATKDGYNDIIQIGDGSSAQSTLAQVPYEIAFDRVYVHGSPLYGQKRCIALNGRSITIRNSHVSDCKMAGNDAQAIGGWNGPGPFLIENNYLEASGENFLLGGSDPSIPNLVSEDVIVRYNYMSRPMSWRDPIIPTPANVRAAAAAPGTLPGGAYAYQIVARRPVGQGSTGSSAPSAAATATASDGAIGLSWDPVPDATEYQVYGRSQMWTVAGTSFVDNGTPGKPAMPSTEPTRWQVKNVFELKNARRVRVESNVFENNWRHAQPGYAIVFTPRNQEGRCTWCVIEDVTFDHNIVRNSGAGFNIAGFDFPNVSGQTTGVVIRDNLVYGITEQLGGNGWAMQIGDEPKTVVVDHNTFDFDGTTIVYAHGGSVSAPRRIMGFQYTNNASPHASYGINGAAAAFGSGALQMYFPGAVVTGNWFSGGPSGRYPAGNRFDGGFASAFTNRADGDYRLVGALAAPAADGRPVGADAARLLTTLSAVRAGRMAAVPRAPTNVRIISRVP